MYATDHYTLPDTIETTQAEMVKAERLADICRRHDDRANEIIFRNRLARLRTHERNLQHRILGRGYTQNGGTGVPGYPARARG